MLKQVLNRFDSWFARFVKVCHRSGYPKTLVTLVFIWAFCVFPWNTWLQCFVSQIWMIVVVSIQLFKNYQKQPYVFNLKEPLINILTILES